MKNIILIGMPGVGKSTVGVILAKASYKKFMDTDLVIQQKTGGGLQTIVDNRGVEAILDIEEKCILEINEENTVIATGGSAVLRKASMEHLKQNGTVVFLDISYGTIVKRIKNIKTRGIAMEKDETLLDVYNKRMPFYRKYAQVTINCEDKTIEKIVDEIIRAVN